jgi:hypothetical protein
MGLFDPGKPPLIETSKTVTATAPQYLTDYLTDLATRGREQLGVPGSEMVAAPSFLQQKAFEAAPGALTAFQAPMTSALAAGQAGAAPVTQADISAFYNPYEQSVVNEMARQSAENVQQQYLPQLRAAFGGTGAFGSRRYAGAVGQSLADVQADLLGQQSKFRAAGYQSALDAALRQKAGQTQAASALGGIGTGTQAATTTGLKALSDLGGIQQAYEQAKIEAPTVRAQNVAQILRGYTYPTTTSEKALQPPPAFAPSPLQQLTGLGALIGSGTQTPSGWGNRLFDFLGKQMGSGAAPTGYGTSGTNPIFGGVDTDGTMAELERFGGI